MDQLVILHPSHRRKRLAQRRHRSCFDGCVRSHHPSPCGGSLDYWYRCRRDV